MPLELTKEAEAKLKTLAVCLDLENESTVVNELFYQFVLNQESDKRRMIMSEVYANDLLLLPYSQPEFSNVVFVSSANKVLSTT